MSDNSDSTSYVYLLVVLLMSDKMSYYLLTNVIHIGQFIRQKSKTSPDATHYTEPRKINNFDATLIGTAPQMTHTKSVRRIAPHRLTYV